MKIITKKLGEKYHKKKGVVKVRTEVTNGVCERSGWVTEEGRLVFLTNQVLVAESTCLRFLLVLKKESCICNHWRSNSFSTIVCT